MQSNGQKDRGKIFNLQNTTCFEKGKPIRRRVGCVRLTVIFEGDSTRIEVGKRNESIIETLKERF